MSDEVKIDWLMRQCIAAGQRLALLWDGGKKAYGFERCFKADDEWRKIITAHVTGAALDADVRFIKTHTTFNKHVDVCQLGLYYGGDTDEGNNVVSAYSLDCDTSDTIHDLYISLPPEERVKGQIERHITQAMSDNESKRLSEMLKDARQAFPHAMFFQKPNGKWHAYGRLERPRPACAVKKHVTARLPACCRHIEVFPKTNDGRLADGQWFNANHVRLPFSKAGEYGPVGELRPLVGDSVAMIPTHDELDAAKRPNRVPAAIDRPLTPDFKLECIKNYVEQVGTVGLGERHKATYKIAALCVKDHGLDFTQTHSIVDDFNRRSCCPPLDVSEIEKQIQDATKYAKHPAFVPVAQDAPMQQAPDVAEQPTRRPDYVPPTADELNEAIKGSPIETYITEVRKISEKIPRQMICVDAIQLAGLLMANVGVKIGDGADDPMSIAMNVYSLKIAGPSRGKGLTSRYLLHCAKSMGIPKLDGESESALVAAAESAPCGLYYKDELKKIIDPSSVTARQITNFFLGGFDSGEVSFCTRPKGELKRLVVTGAYPSLLIDGQPTVFEESLGKSLADAGFLARFLIAMPASGAKITKTGTPDYAAIYDAYKVFKLAKAATIIKPQHTLDCAGERYEEHMTEPEQAAWGRLSQMYVPKIALILDPSALATGHVTTAAMDRAAVIASFFMANSIKVLGLVHADREEMLRSRAVRAIAENVGCNDRYLYNRLKVGVCQFTRDIAPTIIARGDAYTQGGRWYPGEGVSDAYCAQKKKEK